MKNFILKLLKFVLSPILLFLILDVFINFTAKDKGLNSLIEAKIAALPINNDEINIIIAGDSRAERQLIPEIIALKTGFNTINIAVSNGELVSSLAAIKEHYTGSNFIYVISASSFQINDGAIDPGYLSEKCFQQASLYEKIILYKNNITGFSKMYGRLLKLAVNSFTNSHHIYDTRIIKKKGFFGVEGNIEILKSKTEIQNNIEQHKHYKNLSNNYIRWNVFKKSINELNSMKSLSFIIQPPLSFYAKEIYKNSKIEQAETEYSNKLKKLAIENKNIEFYDFYTQNLLVLNDSLYYDSHHLNYSGAEVFSAKISELILEKIN